MKKVLFLTPQLPYPPISGGTIKSWKIIEYLSKKYNVTLCCFLKGNDSEYVEEFLLKIKLDKFYSIPYEKKRNLLNWVKSVIFKIPLNIYRNRNDKLRKYVKSIKKEYECIFVDHYLMFQYVENFKKSYIIFHQHNAEFVMWQRLAELNKNLFMKTAIKIESNRIAAYEKCICKKAHVVFAAPNDIKSLISLGLEKTIFRTTYHLGVEELLYETDLNFDQTEEAILFVGNLQWEANIDGLLWFLKGAWKEIKRKKKNLVFYIVGKNPDKRIVHECKKHVDVILTGFIDNLLPIYNKSRVCVCPLRFGSGIKVKIINSLYRGLPVVTTPVGVEGLSVINGKELFFSSELNQICKHIVELLSNRDLWSYISVNGRSIAKKLYTWDNILKDIDSSIDNCISG